MRHKKQIKSYIQWVFLLCLLMMPIAQAQSFYTGELTLRLDPGLLRADSAETGEIRSQDSLSISLQGHLEAELDFEAISLQLMLDPGLSISTPTAEDEEALVLEPGITEAYALWRSGDIDVSAGIERLPLETARLTQPFSLEPVSELGLPQGLLGARASYYLNDWRLRSALFYQDEQLGAVFSVRRNFVDFELEGHAVLDENLSFGLGGSGLLADLVVYVEVWLIDEPPEILAEEDVEENPEQLGFFDAVNWRGAIGLSGFLDDALWTLEAAKAPLRSVGAASAVPQVLAQISLPVTDVGALEGTLGLALTESVLTEDTQALQTLANVSYNHSLEEANLQLGLNLLSTETTTVYGYSLAVTYFF